MSRNECNKATTVHAFCRAGELSGLFGGLRLRDCGEVCSLAYRISSLLVQGTGRIYRTYLNTTHHCSFIAISSVGAVQRHEHDMNHSLSRVAEPCRKDTHRGVRIFDSRSKPFYFLHVASHGAPLP